MLRSGLILAALSLATLSGCPKHGASAPSESWRKCGIACDHLRELGCQEGTPTAHGAACEDVCANVMDSNVLVWDLACMVTIESCAAIDTCEV